MDFIRPAYFNPADIPESIRKKIPWIAEAHEQGFIGPGPKPASRDDGVYCVCCALWDIEAESHQYKPKPRTPKQSSESLAFRDDPSLTNLRRMMSRVAIADNIEEITGTTKTSLNTNQAGDAASIEPEVANQMEGFAS
ncbi:Nn.00g053810.m01.CDS01 [Neocucurbitaria sp. VM-36]